MNFRIVHFFSAKSGKIENSFGQNYFFKKYTKGEKTLFWLEKWQVPRSQTHIHMYKTK